MIGTQMTVLWKPGEKQTLTIAIGFRCSDGVVLAADTQLTWAGSHKGYETKMHPHQTEEHNVTFTFAGDYTIWKSFNEKFAEALPMLPRPLTIPIIKTAIETILSLFSVLEANPNELNLLCGITVPGGGITLCKTQGQTIHEVSEYEYVGVGDSSLLRFLGPLLTSPPPVAPIERQGFIVRQAVMIATYLVLKAKTNIDGCGGDTDVWIVRSNGCLELKTLSEIYRTEQMMLLIELHLKQAAAHFFDRRFSGEELERTLRIMGRNLLQDHLQFQVPVDHYSGSW